MTDSYHISSLVVRAHPEALSSVIDGIDALDGSEVFRSDELGRIVVVLDTRDQAEIAEILRTIENLPGVLNASLIYHHVEEATAQSAQETL